MKKIFSVILALTMLTALVPMGALATESTSAVDIGSTFADELADLTALAEAHPEALQVSSNDDVITIKLLSDVIGGIEFAIPSADFVLDANGKTFSGGSCNEALTLVHEKNCTVKLTGNGNYTTGRNNTFFVGIGCSLLVESATISGEIYSYGTVKAVLADGKAGISIQKNSDSAEIYTEAKSFSSGSNDTVVVTQLDTLPATYTVSFNSNGYGIAPDAISGVFEGYKISAPTAPTAIGYVFEGWYKEATCENKWDFGTDTVTEDITLYAKWGNIDFIYVGGTLLHSNNYIDTNGNVSDTKPSGGYAYYEADTGTLTLSNFTYEGPGYYHNEFRDYYDHTSGIYSEISLNIVLEGENVLTVDDDYATYQNGISSLDSITFNGSGSLELSAPTDGIAAVGNVEINKGTICIHTTDGDGIEATGDIIVNGGKLTAEAYDDGFNGESITVNGGTIDITTLDDDAFDAKDITINGGSIKLHADDDAFYTNGDVTINDGNITMISNTDDGIDAEGKIIIKGGTLNIDADDNGFTAVENIEISGGRVDIVSGDKAISTDEGYEISLVDVVLKKPSGGKVGEVQSENSDTIYTCILNKEGSIAKTVSIAPKSVDIGGGRGGMVAVDSTPSGTVKPNPATPVAPAVPETPTTPEAPAKKTFSDVHSVGHWAMADVDYVSEKGLMNGTSENAFSPDGKVTRAMLVTILYRNENEPATNRSIPFSDVDLGAYYGSAVIWAKQNGIVNGVTENEFAPNSYITRDQIATIMFRYAQYKGMEAMTLEENLHFADASEISEYAVSAMNWAVGNGLMKGKTESTINSKDNATRAEMAAILHRFIENNK